jgi:hypothetical protein
VTPQEYLRRLGQLYVEGVTADVSPRLLQRLGGSLALAGRDAEWIRFEHDALLGFIDVRRSRDEIERLARRRWGEYRAEIERHMAAGVPPRVAIERTMRRYGTVPHTHTQVAQMMTLTTGPAGTMSRWLYDIAALRQRFQRGMTVMRDPFGALATGAYLIATAENWTSATPAEWDRALTVGEVGMAAGRVAEAAASVPQARLQQRLLSRPGAQTSPVVIESSVSPQTRGTTQARPTARQRGTTERATAGSGRSSAAPRAEAQPRATALPDALNVDEAFGENASYAVSPLRRAERPRHRTGPLAGQSYQSLDVLIAGMAPQQRAAAQRLVNRFPPGFRAVWQAVDNARTRQRMQRVQALWNAGQHDEARTLARATYDAYRGRFWRRVRQQPELMQMLRDAGLEFEGGPTTAPFWRLPNGTRELLTIEHSDRVTDAPWRSVDGTMLRFVPGRENTHMLEFIRRNDPFQNPPPQRPAATAAPGTAGPTTP